MVLVLIFWSCFLVSGLVKESIIVFFVLWIFFILFFNFCICFLFLDDFVFVIFFFEFLSFFWSDSSFWKVFDGMYFDNIRIKFFFEKWLVFFFVVSNLFGICWLGILKCVLYVVIFCIRLVFICCMFCWIENKCIFEVLLGGILICFWVWC